MTLSPAFQEILFKKFTDTAILEDYVEWALSELEAGVDTPNLCILAGLTKPLYWWDLEHHFDKTLDELKVILPQREHFLLQCARKIAGEIVSGSIAPVAGCHKIYKIFLVLEYPSELSNWLYLDEELEPGTYRELSGAIWDAAIVREAKALLASATCANEL